MSVRSWVILAQRLVYSLSELGTKPPLHPLSLSILRPPLLNNLRKHIVGEAPLDDWTPQEQFLGIIGTGGNYALASR